MGVDKNHPAYIAKIMRSRVLRAKNRHAANEGYDAACMERRVGYYARVDSGGRAIGSVMNYNELCDACEDGIIPDQCIVEQADKNGRHMGFFRIMITPFGVVFKRVWRL